MDYKARFFSHLQRQKALFHNLHRIFREIAVPFDKEIPYKKSPSFL